MAGPERGQGPPDPEQHPAPEPEPRPYQRASRFAGERPAGRAYVAAQQLIYEAPQPTDVSVYRLQFNRLWCVAALGLLPPAPVLQALEAILATGQPTELPAEVWQALAERRAQATRRASWVERHHRPGTPL
jgi:hypothetical protein